MISEYDVPDVEINIKLDSSDGARTDDGRPLSAELDQVVARGEHEDADEEREPTVRSRHPAPSVDAPPRAERVLDGTSRVVERDVT